MTHPPHPCWIEKAVILVVDDTPDNLTLMAGLLRDNYRVKVSNNGAKALKIANSVAPPDLILLDIMMPEMDGYEVCRHLKQNPDTADIPVIFLTAKTETADETLGLDLGAVDYLTKPVNPAILMARVRNHLQLKAQKDFLNDQNAFLEQEVRRRTREVTMVQDVTIMALASLAETRDSDTGNHIRRTQYYVRALAEKLRDEPDYKEKLTDQYIDVLFKSAPLHDIGKVGIPDRILLKPGRFEDNEFEIMKSHTTLGRDAIEHAEAQLGMKVDFLQVAKEIAYSHQEKWDGSGYPEGLSGDDIPLSARLMAIADVYDALICRRVYKDPMPHEKAMAIIMEGRGTHFDPVIVDHFVEIQDTLLSIAARFADSVAELEQKKQHLEQFKTPD
ncbi:response regulator [Oceanospirillum sediminis]|uniref:Two-component system response regulator n=1 Tax=Oceanospirillum sediminis TaxID=2760088 RepID=A0A839IT41_9GAMM|nr:two-component system response regulator [Oceanospirillum sediminis]MBB1487597.1 two-component system response regulator [Oceanospirillum sediminis]